MPRHSSCCDPRAIEARDRESSPHPSNLDANRVTDREVDVRGVGAGPDDVADHPGGDRKDSTVFEVVSGRLRGDSPIFSVGRSRVVR